MNNFLQKTKASLEKLKTSQIIKVILGNESCDLDSAISALTYAFILSKQSSGSVVIPVLNIPKEDFPLRTETNFLLAENSICSSNIVFRNEIDLHSLCKDKKLQLILVDHHVLPLHDKELANCVTKIIDHRPQDESVNCSQIDLTINPVGSCCTLIAKIVFDMNPQYLDNVTARLLHDTIILDTVNFNLDANRFKQLDKDMVKKLKEKFQKIHTDEKIFKMLIDARTNISTLTSFQLLRKDLKIVGILPIAGLPTLVRDFANRKDAKEAFTQFCEMKSVQCTLVMGLIVQDNIVHRDIGVFMKDKCELGMNLIKCLTEHEELRLENIECSISELTLYKQGNVMMSRKHVVPIIAKHTNKTQS